MSYANKGQRTSITRSAQSVIGIDVTDDIDTTQAVDVRGFAGVSLDAEDDVTLTVFASLSIDGPWKRVTKQDETDVVIAVEDDQWIENYDMYNLHFVKFVGDVSTTVNIMGGG
jgi:hypothetical protein